MKVLFTCALGMRPSPGHERNPMVMWSSCVALVQKIENVGKAIDGYRSLDDWYLRWAEQHRTQAGILRTEKIPSSIVTHENGVRRRDMDQFQRSLKRGRVRLPPANVSRSKSTARIPR
jgi:hypothetical protein